MPEMTPQQVRELLQAQGLEVSDEDLPGVTHHINAIQEGLGSLEHPDLDAVEPLPIFWLGEEA